MSAVIVDARKHMRLPPERFYWAVFEPPSHTRSTLWSSRSERETRLGYLFETVLPVPLEHVHAVFIPLQGGRVLACGLGRDELQRQAEDGLITLGPDGVPGHLESPDAHVRINLLDGRFEAPVVRRARTRWATRFALALVACTAAGVVGLERRAAAQRQTEDLTQAAAERIYAEVLPAAGPTAPPPSMRLAGELRSLRQTRQPGPAVAAPDAGETLARLLAQWPAGVAAKTESMVITATSVTLSASVSDHDQAQAVASALGRTEGWQAEQPQVNQVRDAVRLTARLKRVAAGEDSAR